MLLIPMNWWAVLASVILFQVIGSLWYSPFLFGKKWMSLMGVTPEKMQDAKKEKVKMVKQYSVNIFSSLILTYAMAVFVSYSVVATIPSGILIALVLWIGFVATTNAMEYIWNVNNKPWELYFINTGYYLVAMIIVGIVLSLWS